MTQQGLIQQVFRDAVENVKRLSESEAVINQLSKSVDLIVEAYQKGGSLFVCGNGGSAADSQHLVAELVSKLSKDRSPIRAFALTVDTSILTAIGNDYGYEHSFSRQVSGLMRKNDVLLTITTSGNSPNILQALQVAKSMGIQTILLTGKDGGKAFAMSDCAIVAPGSHTAQIQESHVIIYHTLCYLIEKALVKLGLCQYKEGQGS